MVHASLLSLFFLGAGAGMGERRSPSVPLASRTLASWSRLQTFRDTTESRGSTGRRYTGDGYLLAQSAHSDANV